MAFITIEEQSQIMTDNMNKMSSFISSISDIIENYYPVIQGLQDNIANLQLSIDALASSIDVSVLHLDTDKSQLVIEQNSNGIIYKATLGVFTNRIDSNIYMFADKDIPGLCLIENDTSIAVTKTNKYVDISTYIPDSSIGVDYIPFYTFTGEKTGTKLVFNINKITGNRTVNLKLYQHSKLPLDADASTNIIDMTLKLTYAPQQPTKPAVKPTYNNTVGKYSSAVKTGYNATVGGYSK